MLISGNVTQRKLKKKRYSQLVEVLVWTREYRGVMEGDGKKGEGTYRYIQLLASRFGEPLSHSGANVMKPVYHKH